MLLSTLSSSRFMRVSRSSASSELPFDASGLRPMGLRPRANRLGRCIGLGICGGRQDDTGRYDGDSST